MRNNILGLGFSGAVAGAEGGFDPELVAPGGGSGDPAEGPSGAPGEGIGGLLPPKGEAQSVRRMAYWELLALGQGSEQMHQGTVRCQVW